MKKYFVVIISVLTMLFAFSPVAYAIPANPTSIEFISEAGYTYEYPYLTTATNGSATLALALATTGSDLEYAWEQATDGTLTFEQLNSASPATLNEWFSPMGPGSTSATFVADEADAWYRCKITNGAGDTVYSKAVKVITIGYGDRLDYSYFTEKEWALHYYVTNGYMAYTITPFGFDMMGYITDTFLKAIPDNRNETHTYEDCDEDKWLGTSFPNEWVVIAEENTVAGVDARVFSPKEPAHSAHSVEGYQHKDLIFGFDVDNKWIMQVGARFDNSTATDMALSADIMIGDRGDALDSGHFGFLSDYGAVKSSFNADGSLQQITMIAAENFSIPNVEKAAALMAKPITTANTYYLGNMTAIKPYVFNDGDAITLASKPDSYWQGRFSTRQSTIANLYDWFGIEIHSWEELKAFLIDNADYRSLFSIEDENQSSEYPAFGKHAAAVTDGHLSGMQIFEGADGGADSAIAISWKIPDSRIVQFQLGANILANIPQPNIPELVPEETSAPNIDWVRYREIMAEAERLQAEIDAQREALEKAEEIAPAEEVKKLVDKILIRANSRYVNGGTEVYLTWLNCTEEDFTELGYNVQYEYLISSKKYEGYEHWVTTNTTTYVHTDGKVGKMYYYKVNLLITNQDGDIVDSLPYTECKYGNHVFHG